MVPRRFSSAKLAIVIIGSINKMIVLTMPKKILTTKEGMSIAGGGPPPNCCDCTAIIIERWMKTPRIWVKKYPLSIRNTVRTT